MAPLVMQNIKEIKEDISIVKLNISKLYKAVISWTTSTEPCFYILLIKLFKTVLCIIPAMPKILHVVVWNWHLQFTLSGVL